MMARIAWHNASAGTDKNCCLASSGRSSSTRSESAMPSSVRRVISSTETGPIDSPIVSPACDDIRSMILRHRSNSLRIKCTSSITSSAPGKLGGCFSNACSTSLATMAIVLSGVASSCAVPAARVPNASTLSLLDCNNWARRIWIC